MTRDVREVFGNNLQQAMRRQVHTCRSLAYASGVSATSISNYVNARSMPALDIGVRLAIVLHTTCEDLICGGEETL